MTHICVNELTIIGSDNGLSPGRHRVIIWTNAGILLIGPLGTNFSEILIENQTFSLKKMHLKMSSEKWRPSCLGLNELSCCRDINQQIHQHNADSLNKRLDLHWTQPLASEVHASVVIEWSPTSMFALVTLQDHIKGAIKKNNERCFQVYEYSSYRPHHVLNLHGYFCRNFVLQMIFII